MVRLGVRMPEFHSAFGVEPGCIEEQLLAPFPPSRRDERRGSKARVREAIDDFVDDFLRK